MASDSQSSRSWRDNACLWAMDPRALRLFALSTTPEAAVLFAEPKPVEPYVISDDEPPQADPVAAVRLPRARGGIAVVPITGPIGQNRRVDWAGVYSEELQRQLLNYAASEQVGAIVLDINSPGGIVYGTPELAQTVNDVKQIKPVYSVATGMAASAAYWVGSQATKFFMSPASEVGSIGVWSGHIDVSRQLERFGVKITLISAGEYKVEGNPYEPLTDEARADMQQGVDSYYADFLADVGRGRGKTSADVQEHFGKGRLVRASTAKRVGMVDGVATLGQVVSTISAASKGRGSAYKSLQRMGLTSVPVEDAIPDTDATDSEHDTN